MRWAGATRWTVLRVYWNGCSVSMLMISGGSRCQAFDSRVEKVCVCIDACLELYVLVGIAVSCVGA